MIASEPESYASPTLDYSYLSNPQAQRFMKKFNLHLTDRVLQRLNLYIFFLVTDLLEGISISAPLTVPHFQDSLESLMESNLTYQSIIRAVSLLQNLTGREESSRTSPIIKHKSMTISNLFGIPFIKQKLTTKKRPIKEITRKNTAPELYHIPPATENPRKGSIGSMMPCHTCPATRSRLCMVAPWQILYHCDMGSGYQSAELLAHIGMTGQVLTTDVAIFLGLFFSQLSQAMLKELARLALISRLPSITLILVDEAFHPRSSYMPPKFPMLIKVTRHIWFN